MGDYAYHAIGKGAYKHAIFEMATKAANLPIEERETAIAEMVKNHEFCNGYIGRSLAIIAHSDHHHALEIEQPILTIATDNTHTIKDDGTSLPAYSVQQTLQMIAIEAMKADVEYSIGLVIKYYPKLVCSD